MRSDSVFPLYIHNAHVPWNMCFNFLRTKTRRTWQYWTKRSTSCRASTFGGVSRIIGTHRFVFFTASLAGKHGRVKPKIAGSPPPLGWRTLLNSKRPSRGKSIDRPSFPITRRMSKNTSPMKSCFITTRSCPSFTGGLSRVAVAICCHRDDDNTNLALIACLNPSGYES